MSLALEFIIELKITKSLKSGFVYPSPNKEIQEATGLFRTKEGSMGIPVYPPKSF